MSRPDPRDDTPMNAPLHAPAPHNAHLRELKRSIEAHAYAVDPWLVAEAFLRRGGLQLLVEPARREAG